MRPKVFRQQLDSLKRQVGAGLENLCQAPAPDTLHPLRVGLRRLRALLRPLSGRKAFRDLYRLAGQVLKASGALRDLEVVATDLATHRRIHAAAVRRTRLQAGLVELASAPLLQALAKACQPPAADAPAVALPDRDALAKRCRRTLERDRRRLRRHLEADRPDLHALRLDIKRLRYQLELQAPPGGSKELERLCAAQGLIGDWHDREVWLGMAEAEPDLRPCEARWQGERKALAQQLPPLLGKLHATLVKAGA